MHSARKQKTQSVSKNMMHAIEWLIEGGKKISGGAMPHADLLCRPSWYMQYRPDNKMFNMTGKVDTHSVMALLRRYAKLVWQSLLPGSRLQPKFLHTQQPLGMSDDKPKHTTQVLLKENKTEVI